MIARTVNKHTPEAQLNDPYFKQFLIKKSKELNSKNIINIDELSCYS
jgi:hypothetical protein